MVSESTVVPPVDKTLRDVNQLIAEDRFAEANRLCFKGTFEPIASFIRYRAYSINCPAFHVNSSFNGLVVR